MPKSSDAERRKHSLRHGPSTIGRSEAYIMCPFCSRTVRVYLWSLAGSGKRCVCGALHTYYGESIKARRAKEKPCNS